MLADDPNVVVAATVSDGSQAVKRVKAGDIDIVVLDIEMPVLDGLSALPQILEASPSTKVIMASALTMKNAEISLKALEAGAADYITKPSTSREMTGGKDFKQDLLEKIKVLGQSKLAKGAVTGVADAGKSRVPSIKYGAPVSLRPPPRLVVKPRILVIGSSTGGPQALMTFFKGLDGNFDIPVLVTQHMPPNFTKILAQHISKSAGVPAAEAKHGEIIEPGNIYVAPGDFHMLLEEDGNDRRISLNQNPPVNYCRPAVDPMLDSIAKIYGSKALVVILTGMGYDGLKGGEGIVAAGGRVIAQDENTSVVWGMPGAVASAGICTEVLPIEKLGPYVAGQLGRGI